MTRLRVRWRAALLTVSALAVTALMTGTALATVVSPTNIPPGNPVVVTADGVLQGRQVGTVDEFLGIPYAAPPVGGLRWRPPQPVVQWTGVRDAAQFASFCAQPPSPLGGSTGSEDCLYLNVFAPSDMRHPNKDRADELRPVIVFIHGGGLTTGKSDDYDPSTLISNGVVVVTVNYRLGLFGFLAHPALASQPGGPSGNYGLMDQQASLRWVQRNIRRFGGDARNVTLFGESAGGLSVLAQLASPGARGLFSRVIVESGAYNLAQQPLAAAETAGEAFAAQAGCADQTAACLRGLPVSAILARTGSGYHPDIDGRVLTQSVETALATGQFNRVPIVNGTNHDEYRLFVGIDELLGTPVTAASYETMISTVLGVSPANAASIAAVYPLDAYPSGGVALGAVGTDGFFACPALAVDTAVSRHVPVYAYEFNDENAPQQLVPPVSFPYGAAHSSELQYLFGLPNAPFPATLSATQQQLATAMRAYWTAFASSGSPSHSTSQRWLAYRPERQLMLSLTPPVPRIETGFATEHRCDFWRTITLGKRP